MTSASHKMTTKGKSFITIGVLFKPALSNNKQHYVNFSALSYHGQKSVLW